MATEQTRKLAGVIASLFRCVKSEWHTGLRTEDVASTPGVSRDDDMFDALDKYRRHATDEYLRVKSAQRERPAQVKAENEPQRKRIRERALELWREDQSYSVNKITDMIEAEKEKLDITLSNRSIYSTVQELNQPTA